jgi:hypothetical protein
MDSQGSAVDRFLPGTSTPCPFLEQDSAVRVRQRVSLPVAGNKELTQADCDFLMEEYYGKTHQDRIAYGGRLLMLWETARAERKGTAIGGGSNLLSSLDYGGADLEALGPSSGPSYLWVLLRQDRQSSLRYDPATR